VTVDDLLRDLTEDSKSVMDRVSMVRDFGDRRALADAINGKRLSTDMDRGRALNLLKTITRVSLDMKI
jgi:hypothetical protein